MKGQAFARRLGFALAGLRAAMRGEGSFRFHILAAVGVAAVLLVTRPAAIWWGVMVLTIGLVMMAELFNTAIETLCDRVHPDRHPAIGAVKDIAAGAVLVASAVSLVVATAFVAVQLGL